MTLQQLHEIPKFSELFIDRRFIAAIAYMREHPRPRNTGGSDATAIIKNEGSWCGWFDFAQELEALSKPPSQPETFKRSSPYRAPEPTEL